MKLKSSFCLVVFLVLMLSITSLILEKGQASEKQKIDFKIIAAGDMSGYLNETYLAIRLEVEWTDLWEKYIAPFSSPQLPCPDIDFSRKIVVCAFMGACPNTGYSLLIERIWTDNEKTHVEMTKHSQSKDSMVPEATTYPYVLFSFETSEKEVVVHVTEENGDYVEHVLPEFPMTTFALVMLTMLFVTIVVSLRKLLREPCKNSTLPTCAAYPIMLL